VYEADRVRLVRLREQQAEHRDDGPADHDGAAGRSHPHPGRRDTSGQRGADPGRSDVHVAGDGGTHRGLTHASFFSGVGGLDLGLERAGWRTVSFSEVDPYASAVLAARWPGVPNLGDITRLADRAGRDGASGDWRSAHLWSGGFPCQGLSVAGKRRGLADERSGLAFAFLDLVGQHRPPWVLLENVPGLLSSHAGRDLGALLGALGELGYGWAYRVLDARHFGVPQRRRRVFILAHTVDGHPDADGPAAVLAVGTRCRRHPPTGIETGEEPAPGARAGVDIARAVTGTSWKRHDDDTDTLIASAITSSAGHHGHSSPRGDGSDNLVVDRPPPDPDGVRKTHELARWMDHRAGLETYRAYHQRDRVYADLAPALDSYGDTGSDSPAVYVKAGRAQTVDDAESWRAGDVMPTLNAFDVGDARTTAAVLGTGQGGHEPDGLDSHRYRCCGNGVVSSVAEWIGLRLASHIA
jgi:DNA-cytosine methyltransferase